MENNKVTTRKNTKKLIILLSAFFVLCGVGLGGVFAWKNWKEQVAAEQEEQDKDSDDKVVNGDLVLDAEGMPEDGSDITEVKKASDSKTLRELLKSAGKFAVELTEDVRIEEELIVNGTKKLIGSKSITMELYAEPFQSVLSVKKGATLILDGVTVDGSGIASGVTVEKGAGFTGLSGRILYPAPYGIAVAGIAKVDGINIEKSIDIGLCAQEGSTVQLNGGKIIDSNQTNVHIQATANVTISGDPLIDGSRYGVRNRGTCVMTGGTICDVSGYFVYNTGHFTVDYKGNNADDRLVWSGAEGEAGIRTGVGSSTYVRGVHIRDCKQKGIATVNHDDVVIENCVIENTGNFGFSTYNGKKEAILKNVQVIDAKASAIRASKTPKVSITDVTVKNATGFGIKNENTLVVVNNVVVENGGSTGIWGSLGSETQVNGATIVKPGKHGVENNSGKMILKNVTVTDPQRTGYVGKKESVTDITNLTIKNATNWGVYNLGGNVTARNVTVLSAGTYGVATAKSGGFTGFIKVTNLTVDGVKEKDAVNCYESVLEVTNAKLTGAKRHGALASKNGQMVLKDVDISDCEQRGVMGSGGVVTLKRVNITKCGKYGVTTAKTKEYTGSLTAEDLTITDITGNALNNNGSVMTITRANISDITSNGAYTEKGSELTLTEVELLNCAKRGLYVNSAGTKATFTDVKVRDAKQTSLFQGVGTKVTAKNLYLEDSGTYGIFVQSATLDGQDVTMKGTGDNGLHISSSTEKGQSVVNVTNLNIKNPGKRGVANTGGKVSLANVTITKPGAFGASTSKTGDYRGELVITNLTLKDVNGKTDHNALNCNGSVLKVTKGTISEVAGNGAYVENGGQLILTDMDIKNCAKRGVYAYDEGTKAVITDTTFAGTGQSTVFLSAGTELTATNMTVASPGSYGVYVQSAKMQAENVTITDSIDTGLQISSAVETGQSVVNVNGLTVQNAGKRGVANTGGKVTLANVTITNPGTFGATTSKTGDYEGELLITNLTVKDVKGETDHNALNCNASVLKVTKGTISEVAGNGAYVENGGQLILTDMDIKNCAKRGIYAYDEGTKAVITDTTFAATGQSTVFLSAGTELEAKNMTVTSPGSYGVYVQSAKMYAENITVTESVENSLNISNVDEGIQSEVEIHGLTLTSSGDRGVGNTGGKVILTDVTITNPATYGATSSKTDAYVGELDITNLTITGGIANNALNCNGSVLKINKGTISGITGNGAYVEKGAQVTLTDVEITGCGKRGIYANGSTVNATLNNVKIADTVMQNVRVKDAKLDATDLVVMMNDQMGQTVGEEVFYGICMLGNAKMTINGEKSTVTRNAAAEVTPENSAIMVDKGTLTINNGIYRGLRAKNGGVIYSADGTVTIAGGTFEANTADKGGVLYKGAASTLHITGGTFGTTNGGNIANGSGGVLYIEKDSANTTTIDGAVFYGNKAVNSKDHAYGGVICVGANSDVEIGLQAACRFEGNESSYTGTSTSKYGYGGCIFMATSSTAEVTVKNTTFLNNTAMTAGGAVCVQGGSLKVEGGHYSTNKGKGVLEDVRCNNAATLTLSGQVNLYVGLNNTSKMIVNEALHADSKVYFRIVNATSITSSKTRNVVEFAAGLMPDASQTIFGLYENQESKYAMKFANNKLTLSLK